MRIKFSKLLISVLSIGALFLGSQSVVSAANLPDEAFTISAPPGNAGGYLGMSNIPNFLNHFSNPYLLGKETSGSFLSGIHACKSFTDPACAKADLFQGTTEFDFCLSADDTNCIDAVTATKEDGTNLPVSMGDSFPGARDQDYVGDPSIALPNGGKTHLIHIPGASHASGDLYLPIVNPIMELNRALGQSTFSGKMQMALFAVSIKNGSYNYGRQSTDPSQYVQSWWNVGGGAESEKGCILNDGSVCAIPEAMPTDITYKVSVRVNFPLLGWFSGRLTQPDISIKSLSNGSQLLSVSAKPVRVSAVAHWLKKTELGPDLSLYYQALAKPLGGTMSVGGGDKKSFVEIQKGDPESWSLMRDTVNFDSRAMGEFLLWLPAIGDKADAVQTMWSARTMNSELDQCLNQTNSVTGFVSSNATQYIEGPPTFENSTQTLNYKVAAPHFEKDGTTVFKGTYDLAIKSEAARCLYHFTNAPVGATIEVLDNRGKSEIAVTSMTERDGWIYLRAAGFTFSNPTLKVKLTQNDQAKNALVSKLAKVYKSGEQCKITGQQVPGVDDFGQIVYLTCKNSKYGTLTNSTYITATDKARVLYLQRANLPANQVIPREGNPCTPGSQWSLGYNKKQVFSYLSCSNMKKFQSENIYGGNPDFDKQVFAEFLKDIPTKKK